MKARNELLADVTPQMHKVRRASLGAVVTSLSVTSLGRNIDSKTTEKHQINRLDADETQGQLDSADRDPTGTLCDKRNRGWQVE